MGKTARRHWRLGASLAAAAVVLAACGSSPSSGAGGTSPPVTTTPKSHKVGGTVYWAQAPQATPNWIFPFADYNVFSVANQQQFQYLMYRPLYYFGQVTSAATTVNYPLSLAAAPVWSNNDKTVTINLKGWKWSNGQSVDAQSVIFWLNMMKAEYKNWAGWAPGLFPQNVKSYSATSPRALSVTINLTSAFNTTWYLYNQLSEITPMPEAWDVTKLGGAPGSGGCGKVGRGNLTGSATMRACAAVWYFDTDDNEQVKSPRMAGDLATYSTNPAWQVVDGPWKLKSFATSAGGNTPTFVPNPAYSGPQKPIISEFVELPYTSDTTEFAALQAGGSGAPEVGYIPTQDLPSWNGRAGTIGSNFGPVSSKFTLYPVYDWGINYFPENYNSNAEVGGGTEAGYVFRQLYFRQALQDAIDQPAVIQKVDKGYGVASYGPAPIYPASSFLDAEEQANPYPYNLAAGRALLTSHGWTIPSSGPATCTKPGSAPDECGAGIHAGAKLSFKEIYAGGLEQITETVNLEASAWSQEGIDVATSAEPFDSVIGLAVPCAMSAGSKCAWEFLNWGGGWVYSPDYEPTGEEIFATGAGSNYGSYSDPTNDNLIRQTNVSSSSTIFDTWENYLAKQLPVVFQPNPAALLDEISDQIGGVSPINGLLDLTPEYWYFKS